MTYSTADYYPDYLPLQQQVYAHPVESARSPVVPILLVVPTLMSLASWMASGVEMITDAAFVFTLIVFGIALVREVLQFPQRFALGAMTLYGGTLVWYVHDYFSHWFLFDFTSLGGEYHAWVVAKAAFFTHLFLLTASVGLLLPTGRWLERLINKLPEFSSAKPYVLLVTVGFLFGILPFFLFTGEPFYQAMWKSFTSMRSGDGTAWTVGRTGNLNFSWGGYVAQWMQVGQIAGLLGLFVVLMMRTGPIAKIACLMMWLFWTMFQFGSGSRGQFLSMILPLVGIVWIKYSALTMAQMQRFSRKAMLYAGIVMVGVLTAVQIQGAFRNQGLRAADIGQIKLLKNQGNSMFSEGLLGYQWVPNQIPHPRNTMPGMGAAVFLPETALRFAIGWIPRALWPNKPGIDDIGQEINKAMTGGSANNSTGGTIATSIAGGTYIRYGGLAVVEMGLLFGWLCGCVQSVFRQTLHRPFALMVVLGLATYLFRAFRDLTPHDLYPLIIGAIAMMMFAKVTRMFSSDQSHYA